MKRRKQPRGVPVKGSLLLSQYGFVEFIRAHGDGFLCQSLALLYYTYLGYDEHDMAVMSFAGPVPICPVVRP
jgi:hypothetical protein